MKMSGFVFLVARKPRLLSSDLLRIFAQHQKLGALEMRIGVLAFLDAREFDLCNSDLLHVLMQRHEVCGFTEIRMRVVSCIGVSQFRPLGIGGGRLCEREQGQINQSRQNN